jgi:NAD(P)-dependent dehydrogenase (short-subunit alcohol dehydrogenase family)
MTRTHVVTGAASGIGRATAARLRADGDRVITVDRRNADVVVDLSTVEGRSDLVEQVAELSGGAVDAVVACAGTAGRGATDLTVCYFGAVATLAGLRPLLAAGTDPRATAVVSFAVLGSVDVEMVDACLAGDEARALDRVEIAEAAEPMRTYASAKRALARWVRRQAPLVEWAGAGIAINSVGPGVVRTAMTEPLLGDPALADYLMASVPMPFGGVLPPEDVAELIATTVAPTFRGVTGQTIFIDGGSDCVRRGDDVC